MTVMYTALVFPQTPTGGSYSRPQLPSTFVGSGPALTTPTWNPFSANAADRTEYWQDTAGTLTYDAILMLCYGLPALKQQQIATLTTACNAAIVGGYTSSALGTAHTYPSTPTDQMNMNVAVTASLLPNLPSTWTTPFWVADSTGAWSMAEHTAAQIQQAGSDGKAAIQTLRVKLATLAAQVQAATTLSEVQGVTW